MSRKELKSLYCKCLLYKQLVYKNSSYYICICWTYKTAFWSFMLQRHLYLVSIFSLICQHITDLRSASPSVGRAPDGFHYFGKASAVLRRAQIASAVFGSPPDSFHYFGKDLDSFHCFMKGPYSLRCFRKGLDRFQVAFLTLEGPISTAGWLDASGWTKFFCWFITENHTWTARTIWLSSVFVASCWQPFFLPKTW